MWLPILICLGAVALIIGPILLMQPSALQRREATMRLLAAEQGLRVHLQPPPEGASVPPDLRMAAMYCLPCKNRDDAKDTWVLVKKSYSHELHWSGFWDWQTSSSRLNKKDFNTCLQRVPDTVFAIANGPQGLCCYWLEKGGEEAVQSISSWLHETSAVIGG